ncbi:ribonuclease T2 [Martensiomyces pterosporus]|nr:ribonuclease T2 [Martensiomyces pterosporus]
MRIPAIALVAALLTVSSVDAAPATTPKPAPPANPLGNCPSGIVTCSVAASKVNSCCASTNGIVVLVQQWSKGLGPQTEYTLHGLWPNTCSGSQTGTNGCDPARLDYNVSSIIQSASSSLYNQLNTYWSSYKGDNNWFWSHEWSKHGTCVTTLDPKCYTNYKKNQEVIEYFTTVLALRSKYSYYAALAKHGIVPAAGKTYTAGQFKAAIKAELGVDVALKCNGGTLSEIWAYFNVKDRVNYVPTKKYTSDTCTKFTYPSK